MATALVVKFHSSLPVAIYIAIGAAMVFLATLSLKDNSHRDITVEYDDKGSRGRAQAGTGRKLILKWADIPRGPRRKAVQALSERELAGRHGVAEGRAVPSHDRRRHPRAARVATGTIASTAGRGAGRLQAGRFYGLGAIRSRLAWQRVQR